VDSVTAARLIEFQRRCTLSPIEPDDDRYVDLYSYRLGLLDNDPIRALIDTIEVHAEQSQQLLSGYRGTGKTTELNRMTALLGQMGYVTVMFDIEDYLSPGKPVDLTEFLLAFAGALGDACEQLGADLGAGGSLWDRALQLLKRLRPEELTIGIPQSGTELKVAIKESADFTARLRQYLHGRLGELILEVREYVEIARIALVTSFPDAPGIVVVVDSIEHIRGTATTEDEVQQSVERLFGEDSDALAFPRLHIVYTVPPYLRVRVPNVGERFEPGRGIQTLPAIKVRNAAGNCDNRGLGALRTLVERRGDWAEVMTREQLDHLCEMSGGHLRDLMRMMQDLLSRLRLRDLTKASDLLIRQTVEAATREMSLIADDDAEWLWRIHNDHEFPLPSIEQLPRLSRFLDTHMVLCYRNGNEWYDIHPLIVDSVERQVRRLKAAPHA
jgi:hypothetical protein